MIGAVSASGLGQNERQIAAYLRIRSVANPVWLSNGGLAYLDDWSGVPQVWRIDAGGTSPRQVTHFADRIGALAASPDGRRLVFGMDSGGNERQQLWTVELDGEAPIALTNEPQAIHRFGAFSPNGRQFAYSSNRRDLHYFDVYIMDLDQSSSSRMVLQTEADVVPLAFSPDGELLLVERANTNLDNDLLLLPVGGGEAQLLLPHTDEATVNGAAFTPDGKEIDLATNQGCEFVCLRTLDLASGTATTLAAPNWDVEAIAVPSRGKWLAYAVNEGGASRLHLRNLTNGDEKLVSGLPDGVITGLAWSPDGSQLAFAHTSAVDPPEIWTCDFEGRVKRVTSASLGNLDRSTFVAPEIIRYRTFDGREIPAYWFRPKGTAGRTCPVVVDVHGGPEGQRRLQFSPVTQYLLSRGFAILAPNVRGSTGYGKAYCHLDDVEKRMDSVADLAAAVDWLRARSDVDPARIAVMGQSYGGFMTLAALTSYPDLWAAGVDVVGIANFVTFLERTGPWRRRLRAAEYGDLARDAQLLHDISPLHKADRISTPLFIIHGRNDPRVPLGETEQMAAALSAMGRQVELIVFDDEGHGLVKIPNRIKGYAAVANFLERTLTSSS